MARSEVYKSAKATIVNALVPKVQAGTEAYADALRDNVSAGPRSGVQYPGLPRQSSSATEFPQEQFGDLKASADSQPTNNPLIWRAGFMGDDIGKLRWLEYGSGRAPLAHTADDPETRRRMLEAAQKAR
jgi:hypothetical protein